MPAYAYTPDHCTLFYISVPARKQTSALASATAVSTFAFESAPAHDPAHAHVLSFWIYAFFSIPMHSTGILVKEKPSAVDANRPIINRSHLHAPARCTDEKLGSGC